MRRYAAILIFFALALTAIATWSWFSIQRGLPKVHHLSLGAYPLWTTQDGNSYEMRISKKKPESWASLEEINDLAIAAVVVSEDWAFFDHKGFDASQIKEALLDSLQEGRLTRGASTITQQVIKNVFLTSERSFIRKIKEFILAQRLEESLSKRKILEIYLNIAHWGDGIYGISQAAWYYFQKHPALLNAKEGAFLAMLLPSPIRYAESFRKKELTPYAHKTITRILKKMKTAKMLDDHALHQVLMQPLGFESLDEMENLPEDLEDPEETLPASSEEPPMRQ